MRMDTNHEQTVEQSNQRTRLWCILALCVIGIAATCIGVLAWGRYVGFGEGW